MYPTPTQRIKSTLQRWKDNGEGELSILASAIVDDLELDGWCVVVRKDHTV